MNDGWVPPPKRTVKVGRETLLAFYDSMTHAEDSEDEEEKALLARAMKPGVGTRGKFLKTLGYR